MSLYIKYIQHLMGAWWLTILVLLAWLNNQSCQFTVGYA